MMKEKFVISERGKTFYWVNENVVSNNLGIVFCHGLTADHTLFDKQIDAFSKSYRVITWDFPLHGKSKPYKNFTYLNVNQELASILEAEAIKEIIIIGQSAGGYVSQAFIQEFSRMVKGFVGIGTTPFGKKYYKKSELFWLKHYTTIAKLYPYKYYCSVGAKGITYTEEARERIYQTLVNLGKEGMLEAAGAVYGEFLKWEEPVEIKCPVLLTIGEYDKTGLVKKYNQLWATEMGYPLKVITRASHNANYDNYEEFNYILEKFIGSII